MLSDIGLIAWALGKIADLATKGAAWWMDEAGYAEWNKRRKLAAKRKEVTDAIDHNDWAAVRVHMAELERLSDAP